MELFILRFVACVEILAAIALGTAVAYMGIVEVQRRVARWLLLDARAWAAQMSGYTHFCRPQLPTPPAREEVGNG